MFLLASLLGSSACVSPFGEAEQAAHVQLSGAIFTTLIDGTRVNANIYPARTSVYLDGGPGPNAPPNAAGLPAGQYFFQVTDPSGATLLSEDAIGCRGVVVNADGVITGVVTPAGFTCTTGLHTMGFDEDQAPLARTVRLMPYAVTPNNGGEYKVWLTPVGDYDAEEGTHGFINAYAKTDNYKVREEIVAPPACGDGNLDQGEACDDGNTTSGDGCSATCDVETPPCCGDGTVDDGEACDDGNTVDGDGCSATCEIETPPCCGDGTVDDGEACDDGNTVDGDGCSATCEIETPPCCGDGTVDDGEACDDGNTVDGDGCSATCTLEPECEVVI